MTELHVLFTIRYLQCNLWQISFIFFGCSILLLVQPESYTTVVMSDDLQLTNMIKTTIVKIKLKTRT